MEQKAIAKAKAGSLRVFRHDVNKKTRTHLNLSDAPRSSPISCCMPMAGVCDFKWWGTPSCTVGLHPKYEKAREDWREWKNRKKGPALDKTAEMGL